MTCTVDPERLVAWLDGDLHRAAAARLAVHVETCPTCSDQMARLAHQAHVLRSELDREVPAAVLARLRSVLPAADPTAPGPDLMTLDEVARYLRITLDDLDQIASDLPAFEVAGQIRVRRAELRQWIARREQEYAAQRLLEETTRGLRRQAG